jgi:hypothetical protein
MPAMFTERPLFSTNFSIISPTEKIAVALYDLSEFLSIKFLQVSKGRVR